MSRKYLLLIIAVAFLGCKNNLNRDHDYVKALKSVNEKLVSHFPKEGVYRSFSLEVDTSAYYNTICIKAMFEMTQTKVDEIYKSFEGKFIKNNDNHIIVVNSFLNKHNFPNPATIFCGEDCLNKTVLQKPFFVLPNFYLNEYQDSMTVTKLPPEFEHVILEQNEGIYSDKINRKVSSMPSNFFHGYSKGISINRTKCIVIYWVIVW